MSYIFGYGALNTEKEIKAFNFLYDFGEKDLFVCKLKDYKLTWESAFYNHKQSKEDISYINPYTKELFEGILVQLSLKLDVGEETIGVLYKTNNYKLKDLDKQNPNYERVEITKFVDVELAENEKVYTYISKEKNQKLYKEELLKNNIYLSSIYYDTLLSEYNNLFDKKEFWRNKNYEGLKEQINKIKLSEKIKFIPLAKKINKLHI